MQLTMTTTNGDSYKMHNPGLAKSHPSVLRGNRILICVSGGGFISKFEGVIYCACLNKTINLWKAGLCADGFSSKVSGISRSAIIQMEMEMNQGIIMDGFEE